MLRARRNPAFPSLAILVVLGVLAALPSLARAADPPDPDSFFGVVSQRHFEESDYDLMKNGRLGSFRLPVDWSSVERRGDGRMYWDYVDEAVRATAERGIDLLPTLYNSPAWMNGDRRTLPLRNVNQIRQWRGFLAAIVGRYGTDGDFWVENPTVPYRPVMKWQIWNEPNIRNFAKPVSPKLYAKLLRISAQAIKGFDPRAKIMTGGLYANPPDGTGIEASEFVRRLYRFPGTRASFDIVAIHPYAVSTRQSIQRTWPLRRVLNRHGNKKRPMTITELGWGSDSQTVFGRGTRVAQAKQVGSAYRGYLRLRKRLKLESIYWFSWADVPGAVRTCSFCRETGFFDQYGDPKPSWFEMLRLTRGAP